MEMTIFSKFFFNDKPDNNSISELIKSANFELPFDYIELIKKHDGGEGKIGKGYLAIWPIMDVVGVNEEMEINNSEVFEKYFVFASNSGIFQYAFERSTGKIYEIDPYDDSYSKFMGDTIQEFVNTFASQL